MNTFKNFCLRGMMFGGFGPIVTGIVLFCISVHTKVILNAAEILTAIASTYLLAFIQAGATVFNQIESWPVLKSLAVHFSFLYSAYVICYTVNRWIPFDMKIILLFTAIFITVYAVIWITVYVIIKKTTKQLNENLSNKTFRI